jgi:hypothetical protein
MLLNLEHGVLSVRPNNRSYDVFGPKFGRSRWENNRFFYFGYKIECVFFQQGGATRHTVSSSVPTLRNIFWE